MANPFDDLIPSQPQGGAFDDLIPAKPQARRNWGNLAADALMYGATPLYPVVAAARQGLIGPGAQGAVEGDRRTERLGALGVSDAIVDAAGVPADATAAVMRLMERGAGRALDLTTTGQSRSDMSKALAPTAPIGGSQMWRDVIDYAGTLPGRVTDAVSQGATAPLTEPRTARLAPQDRTERLAYGAGKGAGGAITSFVPAAMIAQAAAPASVAQGVAATLAQRPVMQTVAGGVGGAVTEETKNPWLGMAAGAAVPIASDAVGGAIKRLLTPTMALTPDEQQIVAAALQRGIPLTPAQATGSGNLHRVEQTLRRLPGSGNLADRGFDQQRQALNREVLAQAGIQADRAGPGVIDQAYRDAGQRYEALIRQQGGVRADPQFAQDVAAVVQNYGRRLETDVAPVFRSYVDDLTPLAQAATTPGANPQIAADVYNTIRSDITARARQTNNQALSRALIGLRDTLDDAAARTRPDLAADWQGLRRQYANLSVIDKAMRTSGTDVTAGNVPLAGFRNAVRGADPEGFARGRGDMSELARIAGFLQTRVPNSGTPERLALTGLLAGGAAFEPTTAAVALGAPTAIQAAYQSAPVRQFLTTPPGPFMGNTAPVVESLMLQRLAAALQGGALAPQ